MLSYTYTYCLWWTFYGCWGFRSWILKGTMNILCTSRGRSDYWWPRFVSGCVRESTGEQRVSCLSSFRRRGFHNVLNALQHRGRRLHKEWLEIVTAFIIQVVIDRWGTRWCVVTRFMNYFVGFFYDIYVFHYYNTFTVFFYFLFFSWLSLLWSFVKILVRRFSIIWIGYCTSNVSSCRHFLVLYFFY